MKDTNQYLDELKVIEISMANIAKEIGDQIKPQLISNEYTKDVFTLSQAFTSIMNAVAIIEQTQELRNY